MKIIKKKTIIQPVKQKKKKCIHCGSCICFQSLRFRYYEYNSIGIETYNKMCIPYQSPSSNPSKQLQFFSTNSEHTPFNDQLVY